MLPLMLMNSVKYCFSYSFAYTFTHSYLLPLIFTPLPLISSLPPTLTNFQPASTYSNLFSPCHVCSSIHPFRFTNLRVLTISAINVSKCFTFLLAPFAYVLTCLHVTPAFRLEVPFLICCVLFLVCRYK